MDDKIVSFKIVRDDGEVFIIDDVTWRIPSDGLSGWHSHTVQIASLDNVTRDGGMITNQRVGMVDRSITAEIRNSRANAFGRRQAESFFLPKRNYTVYTTYMGRTRKCDGVQAGFALSEYNVYDPTRFTWTIFCADPYMYSVDKVSSTRKLESIQGTGMPYMVAGQNYTNQIPKINRGFVTGIGRAFELAPGINADNVRFIDNTGDLPTIPRFKFSYASNAYLKIDIDIWLLSVTPSSDRSYYVERTYKVLEIRDINRFPSDSAASSYDNFLIIDLDKKPFKVMGMGAKPFKLEDDSLMRDPYINFGLWAFEGNMTFKDGKTYAYDYSVEIEPMFTGV